MGKEFPSLTPNRILTAFNSKSNTQSQIPLLFFIGDNFPKFILYHNHCIDMILGCKQ